jgi:uncharacterized protein YdaU (DUF1376 family)
MSLRKQPYLPLYVEDFLTDEKLIYCSAEATGVYIRLMCIMHKSEEYGKILLKQKFKQNAKQNAKQNGSKVEDFAAQLAVQLPYDRATIRRALEELLAAGVLNEEPETIIQRRMVKDNEISEKRAYSGKKGGEKSLGAKQIFTKTKKFASNFAQAKNQANAEIEYINEIENEIVEEEEKGGGGEKEGGGEALPEGAPPEVRGAEVFPVQKLCSELLADEVWQDCVCAQYRLPTHAVRQRLQEFCAELALKGYAQKPRLEFRAHFISWLKIQLEKAQRAKTKNPNQPNELKVNDLWE